jgi:DNA polymerase-3 subunit gamma/tau
VEPAALQRLATAADGSMRDALSLTDQALAFGGGALADAEVREMLGTLPQEHLCDLLDCLAAGDGVALLAAIERLAETSPDFDEALAELLVMLHQLTLAQTVPDVLDGEGLADERLRTIVQQFDAPGVQLLYQIALIGRRDLPLAPDPRTGFEMTLLRMLAFQPDVVPSATDAAPRAAPERTPAPAPRAEPELGPEPEPTSPSTAGAVDWHALVASLPLSGMARALADHCDWAGEERGRVTLRMDAGHSHLLNETVKTRLAEALSTAAAREAIETDPNIAALRETFGAEVMSDSIRPRD